MTGRLAGRMILYRVLFTVLTLLVVSVGIFLLAQVLPGDIGRTMLGPYATPEQVATLNDELGLNRPVAVRYFEWLGGFLTGNWGSSPILGSEIGTVLAAALSRTVLLAIVAFLISAPISYLLGSYAGRHPGSKADRLINLGSVGASGTPDIVSGVLLIAVFAVALRVFPSTAQTSDPNPVVQIYYLILPSLAVAPTIIGYLARIVRANTREVVESDYVRTAVLKGIPRTWVRRRHIGRNAIVPGLAVFSAQLVYLLTGIVAIERLFNYPGLGSVLLKATQTSDVVLLATGTLLAAVLLISVNLVADIAMVLLNPRLRTVATT
jgi:peptide/nickel transport system permease protein